MGEKIRKYIKYFYISRTPVVARSTEGQYVSNIRSQSSMSRIAVSIDRRRRDSIEDLNQNHPTSTPIRPSRHHPLNIDLTNNHNDSFSVDSIPRDTYDILSRFPEFRQVQKALANEKKKCLTWSKGFARLQNNYRQLEANFFRMMFFVLFPKIFLCIFSASSSNCTQLFSRFG